MVPYLKITTDSKSGFSLQKIRTKYVFFSFFQYDGAVRSSGKLATFALNFTEKTRLWSYNPRVAQIVAALIELKHFFVIRCTLIKLLEKETCFFFSLQVYFQFEFNILNIRCLKLNMVYLWAHKKDKG